MQNERQGITHHLLSLQKITAAMLFPVAFGLSAIAPILVHLLYGEKWPGLGMVISILVIMPGLSCLWMLYGAAYQAIGRPDIETKISSISLIVMIPILWIVAPYGLTVFTVARFIIACLLPTGYLLWGARFLNICFKEQFKALASPLLMSGIMYLIVSLLVILSRPFDGVFGWVKLIAIILGGIAVYFLSLRIISQDLWHQVLLNAKHLIYR
jgi:O-antigen/teichoic acid export membrane protein